MWAFVGPLLKEDNEEASVFRNVPRHNGVEAWRRLAEPINEDKSLVRKTLLPLVNNPKSATSIYDLESKLEEWTTNCRLMLENGGVVPDSEHRRMALLDMLPPELSSHATMQMDSPEISTFTKSRIGRSNIARY